MIATEFMDSFVPVDMEAALNDYNSFMESCNNEINNMFAEFNMMHEKVMLESEIMDSVPEDMMMVYEAGKKNIFTKVGEFVIGIFNKIKELIDKSIAKLKELTFKNKTTVQKVELLVKKHPTFKDEIIKSFNEGMLDFNDIKSLKELESAYDEIVKMSNKKDVDPKSLRGKWEKAKEKFEKDIDNTTKSMDRADKFLKVSVALALFVPMTRKVINELNDSKNRNDIRKADALARLKEIETTKTSIDTHIDGSKTKSTYKTKAVNNNTGIATLLLEMSRYMGNKVGVITSDKVSCFTKLENWFAERIDKLAPDISKNMATRYQKSLEEVKSVNDAKKNTGKTP